jgi:hypothetical protein
VELKPLVGEYHQLEAMVHKLGNGDGAALSGRRSGRPRCKLTAALSSAGRDASPAAGKFTAGGGKFTVKGTIAPNDTEHSTFTITGTLTSTRVICRTF